MDSKQKQANSRLKLLRIERGFRTAKDFAKTAGFTESTYRAYENGTRNIDSFIAKKCALLLNADWRWIFYGDNKYINFESISIKSVNLPFINHEEFKDLNTRQETITLPTTLLGEKLSNQASKLFVSKITNNSLAPNLNKDDIVIIDTSFKKPSPKGFYLINDGNCNYICLAFLTKQNEVVITESKSIKLTLQDINILGKVSAVYKCLT